MVAARSAAEMPVVVPSRRSTETVNGVSKSDVFVLLHHGQVERVRPARAVSGRAHEPAAPPRHKVDERRA